MTSQVSNKAELLQRLSQNGSAIRSFGIERISLFGSFVRDSKIRANSDVDLVLEFKPGQKSFDNLVDLGDFLEGLLGRKVELLTRDSLKSDTGKHIIATSEEVII
jgi:predicted nucleotidyltransferase